MAEGELISRELTEEVISAAIEVHRYWGPGSKIMAAVSLLRDSVNCVVYLFASSLAPKSSFVPKSCLLQRTSHG